VSPLLVAWQNTILHMENSSLDHQNNVASRIARQTLERRRPDYTDEVRRLIDAGRTVMRRCGTDSRPRVADIVAEADLSNEGFYRHFASKDALVAAILDDGTERLLDYLAHQMAKESEPEDKLRRWVEGIVSQAADDESAAATLAVLWNAASLSQTMTVSHTSTNARLAGLVRQPLVDLGSIDPELDAELVTHVVVGRLNDLLWGRRKPTGAETDHLFSFCLAACSPRSGPKGRKSSV